MPVTVDTVQDAIAHLDAKGLPRSAEGVWRLFQAEGQHVSRKKVQPLFKVALTTMGAAGCPPLRPCLRLTTTRPPWGPRRPPRGSPLTGPARPWPLSTSRAPRRGHCRRRTGWRRWSRPWIPSSSSGSLPANAGPMV